MGTRNDIKHLKECNDNRLREIFDLHKRLSALEAKAGEGKGCACKCWTTGVDFANGKDSTSVFVYKPAPQPGDRIKLRDVPVGRWWVGCFSVLSEWYEHPCKVRRFDGNKSSHPYLVDCSNGYSSWFEGDTIVTLLPEDYEPGRKRVVQEFRVQRMSDGTVQLLDNDGKVVDRCHETDMIVIKPDAWSKDK